MLLSEREKGFVTEEKVREIIFAEMNRSEVPGNIDNLPNSNSLSEIKYIPPFYLSDFLYAYNQDPVLKYTCHNIDSLDVIEDICHQCASESYDLNLHQQLILRHYNELINNYKWIDFKVKAWIYAYITGKNIKTGKKEKWAMLFEDNWGSKYMRSWASSKPGLVPNPGLNIKMKYDYDGCPLSKKYLSPLTEKRVLGFDGLVLCFKSLFHIKRDNSLEDIISIVEGDLKKDYPNVVFKRYMFHNEMELFTNVLNVKKAYEKIIKMCIDSGGGKEIVTSFYSNQNGDKCFVINDTNSIYGKSIEDTLDRVGDLTTDVIKHQINGMCNLFLTADFPDGKSYTVNLWDGKKRKQTLLTEKVGGVKYILEFKKNKQ